MKLRARWLKPTKRELDAIRNLPEQNADSPLAQLMQAPARLLCLLTRARAGARASSSSELTTPARSSTAWPDRMPVPAQEALSGSDLPRCRGRLAGLPVGLLRANSRETMQLAIVQLHQERCMPRNLCVACGREGGAEARPRRGELGTQCCTRLPAGCCSSGQAPQRRRGAAAAAFALSCAFTRRPLGDPDALRVRIPR